MTSREPMLIEVWSDIACPFCYIGKRRLQGALQRFAQRDDVRVEWRSFQLQPQMVTDASLRINEYLATTKGMPMAQVEQMQARVQEMGASEGITFAMDRVVVANTFNAHRLLQAYFTEGANVDDSSTLRTLATEVGLDATQPPRCSPATHSPTRCAVI